jgi:hypothetical protein
LESDTKKIRAEHKQIEQDMKSFLQITVDLQKGKAKQEEIVKKLSREITLKRDKELVYTAQSNKKSAEIVQLQEKVNSLERSLSEVVRNFSKEQEVTKSHSKRVNKDLELEVAGLRKLALLKHKELTKLRKFSQRVLDERSDVEGYFLEALDQVKSEIRKNRDNERRRQVLEYNARMRDATSNATGIKFPPVKAPFQLNAIEGHSMLPQTPSTTVDLRDLSWEDRERVLRLLFAKINNIQGYVDVLPKHSFTEYDQNTMGELERGLGVVYDDYYAEEGEGEGAGVEEEGAGEKYILENIEASNNDDVSSPHHYVDVEDKIDEMEAHASFKQPGLV